MEVLIFGVGAYCALALNPLSATAEIFFIWKDDYQRGSRYDVPEFDLVVHWPAVPSGDSGPFPGRA